MEAKSSRRDQKESARRLAADIRPYTLRVKRDHGGGLWTFEDNDGQLYLAVKSREFVPIPQNPFWSTEEENRKAFEAHLEQRRQVKSNCA